MITVERLKEVLEYMPESGLFYWKKPPGNHARLYLSTAGSITTGYVLIRIDGQKYKAHRLAWLYSHGEWPSSDIDHKNGCPLDNRISNLRVATCSQNQANKRRRIGKPLQKGIRKLPSGKFNARITVSGETLNIGSYKSVDEAAMAYAYAARFYYSDFSRSA